MVLISNKKKGSKQKYTHKMAAIASAIAACV